MRICRGQLHQSIMIVTLFAFVVAVAMDCDSNPDQEACCPMVNQERQGPNCLIRGIIGSATVKQCGIACERKYKQLKESCICDELYRDHFQWLEMGELCDPKEIYHCIPAAKLSEEEQRIVDAQNAVKEAQDRLDALSAAMETLDPAAGDEVALEKKAEWDAARNDLANATEEMLIARGERAEKRDDTILTTKGEEIDPTIPLVAGGSFLLVAGLCVYVTTRKSKKRNKMSPEDADGYRKNSKKATKDEDTKPMMHGHSPRFSPRTFSPRTSATMGTTPPMKMQHERSPRSSTTPMGTASPINRIPTYDPMNYTYPRAPPMPPRPSRAGMPGAMPGVGSVPIGMQRSPRQDLGSSYGSVRPPPMPVFSQAARDNSRSPRSTHSRSPRTPPPAFGGGPYPPHVPPPLSPSQGGRRSRSPSQGGRSPTSRSPRQDAGRSPSRSPRR